MAALTGPDRPADRVGSPGRIFWGLVLIAAGVVALGLTTGFIQSPGGTVVGAACVVAGIALVGAYVGLHMHWWTLIAGPSLLGVGAVILLPAGGDGAIFLGAIGAGFGLVALTSAERWWAIIPAGSLLTLALIALLSGVIGGLMSGALLFLGLGLTFAVVAAVKVQGKAMTWALFPAVACVFVALLIATSGSAGEVVWPLALVAAGVVLLVRATTKRT